MIGGTSRGWSPTKIFALVAIVTVVLRARTILNKWRTVLRIP
jgi:hypothetical protein